MSTFHHYLMMEHAPVAYASSDDSPDATPPAAPGPPAIAPPPLVPVPQWFNNDTCYSLLTFADRQVSANTDKIARLAKGSLSLKNRMTEYERIQNKG